MSFFSKLKDLKKRESVLEYNRHYLGKVVDNNDPLKLERVRFRIQGLHRGIQDSHLPWTAPVKTSGQGNGPIGALNIPVVGSEILVYFIDDYTPIFFGTITREGAKIPELLETNYPHCYGHIDRSGNRLLVDTEANTWEFQHVSGTFLSINQEGQVTLASSGSLSVSSEIEVSLTSPKVSINCNEFNLDTTSLNAKTSSTSLSASTLDLRGASTTVTGSSSLVVSSKGSTELSGSTVKIGSAGSIEVGGSTFLLNAVLSPWIPTMGWASMGSPSPSSGIGPSPQDPSISPPTPTEARSRPLIEGFSNQTNY